MLLGYRTGNNKPILRIERKYYMNRICRYTELPSASPIRDWIKLLWSKDHVKLEYDPRTIYCSSDSVVYDDNIKERVFSFHSRLHINGQDYCTRDTCKEFNYDDSWMKIKGIFIVLIKLCVIQTIQLTLSDKKPVLERSMIICIHSS